MMLAGGRQIKATAAALDIGERTLHRWLTEPDFTALVRRFRLEMLQQGAGRLARLTARAVRTLKGLMGSANERVSLQACKIVVESALKLGDQVELENRVKVLEESLAREKQGRR